MVYSAFDWGQDLLYLKRWCIDHPEAQPMHLAYYGFFDPKDVGFEAPPPPDAGALRRAHPWTKPLEPGWYAVSTTLLRGVPRNPPRSDSYEYFQKFKPVASAAYSIDIYHLTPEDVDRALVSTGHSPRSVQPLR
jgi:hypothetical protein